MQYYLLGIKGAGVSALACILYDLGYSVSGYDDVSDYRFTEEQLKKRNIKIYYDDTFVPNENTIVICSAAFKPDHREIKRLTDLSVKFKNYQEMLGDLTRKFKTISVAGTHGKTTTTSMISQLFNKIDGFNTNYFIGDGHGYAKSDNEYFVIESCEFNKHFLSYDPLISIITNIEIEHMDVFVDLNDIITTYNQFVSKTKEKVIACGDDENILKLVNDNHKIIYYGTNNNNDIIAYNVIYSANGISFDVKYLNEFYDSYEVPFFGRHMLLDTLAVISLGIYLKVSKKEVKEKIKEYKMATRRFNETKVGNNIVIDDYAHHPSEIKATLEAATQKYPNHQLIAVFKPNTYSRTKLLYNDFAEVLALADKSYITDIYCDREKQSDNPDITSDLIINKNIKFKHLSEEDISDLLEYEKAVICFMSCKDISHLKEKYLKERENLDGK